MEFTQRSTTPVDATRPRSRGPSTAPLVAILAVLALIEAFVIGVLLWDPSTHASIDQQSGGTTAALGDPLHASSMSAFWAEERASSGTTAAGSDPLHAPSMSAFWAEERASGGTR